MSVMAEETRHSVLDQSYTSALVEKYQPYLEGVNDDWRRRCMAVLFENEMQHLKGLAEDVRATNVGSFQKYIFPVLRRVFPNLIANEIVSVQPMTAPVGAVFYLDAKYGSSKGGTAEGSKFPKYDTFDRNYSSEYVDGEVLATGNGVDFGGAGAALTTNTSWYPVRPKGSFAGNDIYVIIREMNGTTMVQEAKDDGAAGFTGNVLAGAINYGTGALAGFKFTNAVVLNNKVRAYYYYDMEMNQKVPSVNLDISKFPIEAKTRKLKALWSAEASEDFRAFHGLDAEGELVGVIAQNMGLEVDREIIQELLDNASLTTDTWSATVPAGIAEVDHFASIVTKLDKMAAEIHRKTLRAPANFIVCGTQASAVISQLRRRGDFQPLWTTANPYTDAPEGPRPMSQHGQFGVYKFGVLGSKYNVFVDPFMPATKVLMGLKGEGFLDAGYAWAPYVPLQVTPTFMDPADFSLRKGLRTRYATKLLRQEYYGTLTLSALP